MTGGFSDISHEIRLVKAALLYADRVTLASPKATLLSAIGGILFQPPDVRRRVVREIVAAQPQTEEILAVVDAIKRKPRGTRSAQELLVLHAAENRLREAEAQLIRIVEGLVSDASVAELALALEAGVLSLDPMGLDQGTAFNADVLMNATYKLMTQVVGPGTATYPMFDDSAGQLARSLIEEGAIPDTRLSRATQVGLAARYIDHIEAFPTADMDVILEARGKLSGPLIRFRSALSQMAIDLRTTPLDIEFGAAADDAYRREVAPALLELQDLADQQRFLPALRKQLTGTHAGGAVGGLIAFAATALADLNDFAHAAAVAAGAIAGQVVDASLAAIDARRVASDRMKTNKFLWLYEAPRQLSK